MFDFIPAPGTLAAFSAAAFLLAITPGPDMTLFLARTLTGGIRLGFAALAGAVTGLLFHGLLASLGLSALLAASATAFMAVKIAGALYLLFLAVQAIRHGSALSIDTARTARQSVAGSFLTGLCINLTNPKIVMFFVTFLPQFVSPEDPQAGGKLMFLGLWFIAIGVPVCSAVILTANRFTRLLQTSPRLMRGFDYGIAGLMSAFALRLLLTR